MTFDLVLPLIGRSLHPMPQTGLLRLAYNFPTLASTCAYLLEGSEITLMMLTTRCVCKRQHTDWSEVTNGYGVLCGCESGIFENVPTKEGEECKVCSIKTRARLACYNAYDKRDKCATIVSE